MTNDPRSCELGLRDLSYEATDVRKRSLVGSYVIVKEKSISHIYD